MKHETTRLQEHINQLEEEIQRLNLEASRSKLIEESLKESISDYELLFDNIPGSVYKGYRDWQVVFFDDKIETLSGYPKEIFNSRRMKWSDLIVADDLEAVKYATKIALRGNRSYLREYRIRIRNGEIRWIQDRGTIVCDQSGDIKHLNGIFFDITEKKQAEDEITRTKMELEQIFRTAADGMRVVYNNFDVFWVNDTFTTLSRVGKHRCHEKKCYEVLSGPLCHTPECPVTRILETAEERIELETEKKRLDGSRIQCILTATPFRNERGEIVGIVEDFKDITERRQTEESLARSEANYRLLLRTIPSIVFRGYKDWSVDFLDNKIEKLTGYPMQHFNSRKLKWSDIIVQEDMVSIRDIFKKALVKDKVYLREYRIKTATGDIRWIRERSQIVLDENEEFSYVGGTFSDITERQQMQQQLNDSYEKLEKAHKELEDYCRVINDLNENLENMVKERTEELVRSESKYKRLVENSKDVIYICNENGEITDINPSGCELLGFKSQDDVQTLTLRDILQDPDEADKYHETLKQQGFIKDYEVTFKTRDDRILNMLITASAIVDEAGKFVGCEGIARDVTELRRVTEHLLESQKMATVGQLAAGVAHEINTPLMVILAHSQLLADEFPEGSETLEDLKVIEEQTKICGKIVADLLDFSRGSETVIDSTDINQTIEDVLAVLEHSLNIDRIYIIRDFAPDLPPIFADSEKLKQAHVNMLNNSHDAMDTDGAIVISTQHDRDSEEIVISFIDTGPGIPAEIKHKVFDPFFTTKEVGKGTGLGLAVTFGIVKQHGGYIEVESPPSAERLKLLAGEHVKKRGQGTAFIIHLPAT
ncbi:MAG: PAS domain S-box protein [Syntrophobacteria bacterium]